jgi:hypothetical protein
MRQQPKANKKRQHRGLTLDAGLSWRVVRLLAAADKGRDRRDGDDAPARRTLGGHLVRNLLNDVERAVC